MTWEARKFENLTSSVIFSPLSFLFCSLMERPQKSCTMADIRYLQSRQQELDGLVAMKNSTEKLTKYLECISNKMDGMNKGMAGRTLSNRWLRVALAGA
jgi:hypothetical protein